MDRAAADDAMSDVAVKGDTLYRRPPANPPAQSTTGGSWFTGGTDVPAPAAPEYGPATPVGSGRASYGFTATPISPMRHGPTSAPPAPASSSSASPSPVLSSPGSSSAGPSGSTGALRTPSGEHAAWRTDTGERRLPPPPREAPQHEPPRREAAPAPALPPRQSRMVTLGIVVLSAVVLVAGSIVGVMYFSGSDDNIDSVLQLGAGGTGKRTVSAPLDNRTKASFELLAGANTVHVTIGELGDDLYRISTPDDAGILPSATIRNDDVKLQTTRDGDGTGGEIEIVLAAKVRWQLRFSGYAEKQRIDVSGGQISGIEMVAGMREAELTLSQPAGTVPVKINGAVDKLVLKAPAANPVRIKVGGGAQTVVAGTRTLKDVTAGSTLTPKGWDTTDRYDVTAGARITALTVESA
ncbi:hypothetical protein ACQP2F_06825 [Actinoplanes sp. CA-030573]|uniref:hypothetical protein n=1 Tax=Actinoplanes sp. CA-030573 TaxID=3239898 RepID=UPI003D8B3461